jgi:hypothetical protein
LRRPRRLLELFESTAKNYFAVDRTPPRHKNRTKTARLAGDNDS